ncbi:hypothetical protein [Bifidobacterium dentium]|jgi:hypothetical protein|uniref:hypothetical protein n=1 Tax=Bifidobacterium dentium TaxID=1689 RepID=UPI003D168CEB
MMVSLIYLGKENPISYKTVFGMDGFNRHDADGGNQTADSTDDTKAYPESASGYLINDLGKLLNMNPDFYRRRIRRIRPAAIAVGLSAICLIAIFLIPDDSNPVFQNFFSALFGFFLGLASSVYEKFRKWADRVNQTMKDAEGRMPIWEVIYKNSIFYDECFITLPTARVSPTWAQRAWIKIRFPSLSRKWHKYFRNGMAEPGLQPLSNERKRRKRLHYLESLSRCVFTLEPYQATLDYLLDYSRRVIGEEIRKDKILKGYIPADDEVYVCQKNVGK